MARRHLRVVCVRKDSEEGKSPSTRKGQRGHPHVSQSLRHRETGKRGPAPAAGRLWTQMSGAGKDLRSRVFLVCVALTLCCDGRLTLWTAGGPASRWRVLPSAHSFAEGTVLLRDRLHARAQTHLRPRRAKRPAPFPVGPEPSSPLQCAALFPCFLAQPCT